MGVRSRVLSPPTAGLILLGAFKLSAVAAGLAGASSAGLAQAMERSPGVLYIVPDDFRPDLRANLVPVSRHLAPTLRYPP